ncbi:hypothetical protein [Clostridium grantii]|uniref:Uncharacterized protein n=1 Tax=Clostridium grantii DSM 8605 TaxID=1121316 RepID=A0A1M5WPI4_9CLOT|nr:hypothetical protein [Clostridium grantii]SHH89409.1 hypothetical protein SAMN02745207_03031 [Clostridium grantii DSM 8605]
MKKENVNKKVLLPYIGGIIALISVIVISKISQDVGFYFYVIAVVVIIVGVIRMVIKAISKDK